MTIRQCKSKCFLPCALIVLFSCFRLGISSSPTEKESERTNLNILAVPWSDSFPSSKPSSYVSTCAFSVVPVHAEEEPTKGIFVQFKLGKYKYIARASLHNGKYCTIDVFRLDVLPTTVRFELIASTKLQHEPLGLKAASCDDTEAYIIVMITKDGIGSDVQLLVFKPSVPEKLDDYVIAHNAQLSGLKGVADVSITCYKEQVVFAFAQSTALSPSRPKEVTSSVHVWSPLSRSVLATMPAETMNSVSVVTFESGPCLMVLFAQNTNGGTAGGPLDTLLYCLSSGSRTEWKIVLIQSLKLCEVNGVELYTNSQNELGLFVAISKKSSSLKICPAASLTMKWTGQEFIPVKNLTVEGVSDFYHLPSSCCNIALARHTSSERSLSVLGSSEALFEDVKKLEFVFVEDRSFFLISFSSTSQQTPLQEFICDRRAGRKAKSIFGAGGTPAVPLQMAAAPTPPMHIAAGPMYPTVPPGFPLEVPLIRNNRSGNVLLQPPVNIAGHNVGPPADMHPPMRNMTGWNLGLPPNMHIVRRNVTRWISGLPTGGQLPQRNLTGRVPVPRVMRNMTKGLPANFASLQGAISLKSPPPPKMIPGIRFDAGVNLMGNRSAKGRPKPYAYRFGKANGTAPLKQITANKSLPDQLMQPITQIKPLVLQPKNLPIVHQRKAFSRVLHTARGPSAGRNATLGQRRKAQAFVSHPLSGPVKLLPAPQRKKPVMRIHYTDTSDEMALSQIVRPGLRNSSGDFDVDEKRQPFLPPIPL